MEAAAIILCLAMCFVNSVLAEAKGYSGIGFGLVSLLNWPIPLIILLFLPRKDGGNDGTI